MTGGVTYTDIADHCRKVGGDLASAPWNYLRGDHHSPASRWNGR